MAYSESDQANLDLNWFFIDHYMHPCHVASAGGKLPQPIAENEKDNNALNEIIVRAEGNNDFERNPKAISILETRGVINLDAYFSDFEAMAKRGFFSFDRYDLLNPDDNQYFLVAYPVYIEYDEVYPIPEKYVRLIPRTRGTVKNTFTNPFNLFKYFDKLH